MSTVNAINSNTTTATDTTADATNLSSQTLNEADFLKLLVAQMSSQDPMNPESNTDFAAQMAQFSALQTAQSTQTSVAALSTSQQIQQANDLIGWTVTVQNADGTTASGTVTGVQVNSGTPSIMVGGTAYTLSQLLDIQPTTTSN
jgi:flagellar basal-body rod modification protein FlgD